MNNTIKLKLKDYKDALSEFTFSLNYDGSWYFVPDCKIQYHQRTLTRVHRAVKFLNESFPGGVF